MRHSGVGHGDGRGNMIFSNYYLVAKGDFGLDPSQHDVRNFAESPAYTLSS